MSEKHIITINSAIIYIIAFLLTTIIHESFHAIFGWFFGSNPIIHHNYVKHLSTEHLTLFQKSTIALAGPLISLTQGVLFGTFYFKARPKPQGLGNLFLLWFSVLGLLNFLGYLMTGFLFKQGDIGKFYLLTETPFWGQITVAVIAGLLLVFVAYKMTTPYLKFCYKKKWLINGKARKHFSLHILFLPWIVGSVIVTLLYLPIIALVSIIYPVMSGMIFIFPWQNADSVELTSISGVKELGKISYLSTGILLFLIIIFKFVLAPGIKF